MAEAKSVLESTQELSLVCQSDFVYSDPGDDVVLSCHLKSAISAASMEIKWWNKSDLVCHYKDGQMIKSYEGRVSLPLHDLHNGNVSLTLIVRRSQKGLYFCEVIHGWRSVREYIFLHIRYFRLVTPIGTVSADTGDDVILPVHLSPETSAVSMDIRWSKATETIYTYNNGRERTNNDSENRASLSIQELERGSLDLTLENVQLSDSGDYTCSVFYDGCLQTGIVHLQVNELQKKSDDKLKQLQDVLGKMHDDLLRQKTNMPEKTLKLLQETIDKIRKAKTSLVGEDSTTEIQSTEDPTPTRSSSTEATLMREDSTAETWLTEGPESELSNSTEGIRPLMESESSDQNTRQREESTATEQQLSSPDTSSRVLLRERISPNAIIQMIPERTQRRLLAIEPVRSPPVVQSQVQERERPSESAAGSRTQTPRRPEDRAQRSQRRNERTEKNCQIL